MRIKSSCKLRRIAGEEIVMSQGTTGIDMTRVIALNESGAYLFRQLQDKSFDPSFAADLLMGEYNVTLETALGDVTLWIDKLTKAGVIE